MHKDIQLYSFSIKIVENKNNTELSFPISMRSFSRLLIRHKMLHFMRAEGLNTWKTGLLCEWERTSGEAMCDISVKELVTTCGGHSCPMCDDWDVFGGQHVGYPVAWARNQEQRDFFPSQEQVFLNNYPGQINGSLSVYWYSNIFIENYWHLEKVAFSRNK